MKYFEKEGRGDLAPRLFFKVLVDSTSYNKIEECKWKKEKCINHYPFHNPNMLFPQFNINMLLFLTIKEFDD